MYLSTYGVLILKHIVFEECLSLDQATHVCRMMCLSICLRQLLSGCDSLQQQIQRHCEGVFHLLTFAILIVSALEFDSSMALCSYQLVKYLFEMLTLVHYSFLLEF